MFRPGVTRPSRWIAVVVALASMPAGVVRAQRSAAPVLDASGMAALWQAPEGPWAVNGRQLTPVGNDAASLLVQADAYGRADGGVVVPLAIGLTAAGPWSVSVRVVSESSTDGRPSADLTLAGSGESRELREVILQPGRYMVTAILVRRGDGGTTVGTVARQTLSVPRLADSSLEATPLVIGEAVSRGSEAAAVRPFVFGPTIVRPATTDRFRPDGTLHLALRVHGWKRGQDSLPDVSVEYVFQQILDGKPRFFNKTKPQDLNGRTLDKSFDARRTMLAAGISLPLAAFPPGDFQVVARVRDRRTQSTTSQTARFRVAS